MAVAASADYTRPFPLDGPGGHPRPGYWLIAKNGRGAIVPSHSLPAQGQGFLYYWLGTAAHTDHANSRLLDATAKLKVKIRPGTALDVRKANHGPYELPGPRKGLKGLLDGVDLIPIPGLTGAGAALGGAEAGAATGAETGGTTGAAAGATTGAATAAGATLAADATGVAALVSFIADPHLWVRLVEIVGGVALLLMGLKALTGGSVDPVGVARKVARV